MRSVATRPGAMPLILTGAISGTSDLIRPDQPRPQEVGRGQCRDRLAHGRRQDHADRASGRTAESRRAQVRQRRAQKADRRPERHVDRLLPLLVGHIVERARRRAAHVDEQHVEPAQRLNGRGDGLRGSVGRRQIDADGDAADLVRDARRGARRRARRRPPCAPSAASARATAAPNPADPPVTSARAPLQTKVHSITLAADETTSAVDGEQSMDAPQHPAPVDRPPRGASVHARRDGRRCAEGRREVQVGRLPGAASRGWARTSRAPSSTTRSRKHYEWLIEEFAKRGIEGEVSVKLTQLGMDVDPAAMQAHMDRLAQVADAQRQSDGVDRHGGLRLHRADDRRVRAPESRPIRTSASACRRT